MSHPQPSVCCTTSQVQVFNSRDSHDLEHFKHRESDECQCVCTSHASVLVGDLLIVFVFCWQISFSIEGSHFSFANPFYHQSVSLFVLRFGE